MSQGWFRVDGYGLDASSHNFILQRRMCFKFSVLSWILKIPTGPAVCKGLGVYIIITITIRILMTIIAISTIIAI